ncbi:hypothetical protein NDU88_004839 [Pleurodeles waltl]|uniref:Uncharacterized protein n=1 Tax=Pleurodeles waltl TaxID=8319 RepID=A0AAV7SJY8_PLEWA|nr:hypothetical protein NDU88_004839 [Pleurodeles waltl]
MAGTVGIQKVLEVELHREESKLQSLGQSRQDNPENVMSWERQHHRVCEIWAILHKHVRHTSHRHWYMECDRAERLLEDLIRPDSSHDPVSMLHDS